MYAFDYTRPASIDEAKGALNGNPEAQLLAGGQTILPAMKTSYLLQAIQSFP